MKLTKDHVRVRTAALISLADLEAFAEPADRNAISQEQLRRNIDELEEYYFDAVELGNVAEARELKAELEKLRRQLNTK